MSELSIRDIVSGGTAEPSIRDLVAGGSGEGELSIREIIGGSEEPRIEPVPVPAVVPFEYESATPFKERVGNLGLVPEGPNLLEMQQSALEPRDTETDLYETKEDMKSVLAETA